MSLREFFELKEKNPHINCKFRIDNEILKTSERIRYLNSLKPEHESLLATKCNLNLPYICDNCLHIILYDKFSSWASGNELIDNFIQETQLFSSYERYPEWVPYNSLSQIEKIGEGGFGTVFSVTWSWGIKSLEEEGYDKTKEKTLLEILLEEEKGYDKTKKKKYHYRSGPCTVALKKLKGDMEITQAFFSEVQAQFDFCHLYGITQDPSTLEYLFIMRFAPQGDLRRYLLRNFDNLSLPSKLDRPHNESLVLDIVFDGLRPQTCHFAPPVYNDLLKRCWDQDSSKRPSIYEVTDFIEKLCGFRIRDKKQNFGDTHLFKSRTGLERPLCQQLVNSHNAGCIYNLMKWKPNKPTHPEAVYTSRLLSYKEYLLSRSKE
ncbi:unnamed protein product [Rhizophagus irregularis]|nr:unnamed protein product [Rhizophagus irregularis]